MKHSFHSAIEVLEARIAPATFIVTSNADSGANTLRAAITQALASMGSDVIEFNLPGGSTQITLLSTLPDITSQIEFHGDTQPGYVGAPIVTLNGAGSVAWGLYFQGMANGSSIVGLKFSNFGVGASIGSSGISIKGSYFADNSANGIVASNANGLIIGGPNSSDRNVITGNGAEGILIVEGSGHVIQNNYIGVGPTGMIADGNDGGGITLSSVEDTIVGGPLPNVISGNGSHGIKVHNQSEDVTFAGNRVGLFSDLSSSVASKNLGPGVLISVADSVTFSAPGMGTSANIVSNNQGVGIYVEYSSQVTILGTLIGAVPSGMAGYSPAANLSGIRVFGSTDTTIGGSSAGEGNVIGFNTGDGIEYEGSIGIEVIGNSFIANSGLPIDFLGDGLSPNEEYGPQNPLPVLLTPNHPILAGAYPDAMGQYHVVGTLNGPLSESFLIHFYGFTNADQKYTFVGSATVNTDETGNVTFDEVVGNLAGYDRIAATALGDTLLASTSEMSSTAIIGPGIRFSDLSVVNQFENIALLSVTVSLTSAPSGAVSVVVSPDASSTATLNTDFSFSPNVLNFGPSDTSETITILLTNDTAVEPTEFIHLVLGGVMGNAVLVSGTKTIAIRNDDTSLNVSSDHRSATWRDVDGDLVTLKATKPILDPEDFQLDAVGTLGGEVLRLLDINNAQGGKGVNLTFSSKFDRALNRGDGSVHVGLINASGLDLGKVVIPGDLAGIFAGDPNLADGAMKSLSVGSMGVLGGTQTQGTGVFASFNGKLGALKVRGDFVGELYSDASMSPTPELGGFGTITIGGSFRSTLSAGTIYTSGSIGSIKIGGSMIAGDDGNAPEIRARGKIGPVTIAGGMFGSDSFSPVRIQSDLTIGKVTVGEMDHAEIQARGNPNPATPAAAIAIASVTVKGRVSESLIGAGATDAGFFNPDAQIGAISVAGDWVRSTVFAGTRTGDDGQWGTSDDLLGTADIGYSDNPNIIAKIAKVTITGHVYGNPNEDVSCGFVAQQIGAMKVSGAGYLLQSGKIPNATPLDLIELSMFGDARLREVL